jgi:hypothetical protein
MEGVRRQKEHSTTGAMRGTFDLIRRIAGDMTRAETYRGYAAHCLALAVKLPDGLDRQHLVEMAVGWYELGQFLSSFAKEHDGQEPELNWPKPPKNRPTFGAFRR